MPVLHNRISNDALKAKMLAETEPRTTISFYKYFTIANPQHTRDALYQMFTALNVFGRVYLAHEGINAQISVPQSNVEAFRQQLYAFDPALNDLRLNIALDNPQKMLLPGMFARVVAAGEVRKNAIVIPQRAVQELLGKTFVTVIGEGEKTESRPVKMGPRVGTNWIVEEGLKPGDRVVVEGALKTPPGTPVKATMING